MEGKEFSRGYLKVLAERPGSWICQVKSHKLKLGGDNPLVYVDKTEDFEVGGVYLIDEPFKIVDFMIDGEVATTKDGIPLKTLDF